jgi:hypothetical protein
LINLVVCAALALFSPMFQKARVAAEKVTGAIPAPVKVTLGGLPEASSFTDSVPLSVPMALGVSVTVIVQVPFAATVPTQLSVSV